MFTNVIVGVDGREGGHDALALARRLVSSDGRVAPAHVFFIDPDAPIWAPRAEESARRERALTRLAAQDGAGDDAELLSIAARSVGEGMEELALTHRADLLVIGACARGLVGRVVIGDDARSVLKRAPCPVALAPSGYAAKPAPVQEIGVAYDGSPESERALATARELAAGCGARLSRIGLPDTLRVDLLVVGTRECGRISGLLHPDRARRLARHPACPLLFVPRCPAATGSAAA